MPKIKKPKLHNKTTKPDNLHPSTFNLHPSSFTDSRFLVPFLLYLVMLYVWRENIFAGMELNVSPDRVSGVSFRRIVAMWLSQGIFPFWNPYFYGGMAMFESFQSSWLFYPLFWLSGFVSDAANPGFYKFGLAWLLFFGSPVNLTLFHHLLGAVGVAYLVRRFGGNAWVQFLAGLAFLISPQLVVLGDVGHGSKLYAMCWLPWLLLTLDWALEKPKPLSIGALASVFAMLMFTQHVQVAYYGYMLAGIWWLCRQVNNVIHPSQARRHTLLYRSSRETGTLVIGGLLGILGAAVIYFNTLTYSQDTIRGSQGVTWEYATNWSYHPLESLSMFVPNFFGFGGQTYWGYLPFTDMPLYWGIPVAVLAVVGLITVRTWKVRALFITGFLAWVTSFGKFLPILYRPFYDYLPYFNKFRVPMMIHIIVLLCAILLAACGLQRVFQVAEAIKAKGERAKGDDDRAKAKGEREKGKGERVKGKGFLWATAIAGIVAILIFMLNGVIADGISGWINAIHSVKPAVAEQLAKTAAESLSLSLLYVFLTCGIIYLGLLKKIPSQVMGIGLAALLMLDLIPLTERLRHPSPPEKLAQYFVKDELIESIESGEKGRLLPLDDKRPLNTWGALGIELETGYSGSKPATFSFLEDKNALTNMNVLLTMNVKYIYSSKNVPGMTPLVQSRHGYLYKLPGGLPRAYLQSKWEVCEKTEDALNRLLSKDFNPLNNLVLNEEPPGVSPSPPAMGIVEIDSYTPNEVVLRAMTDRSAVLVLADSYTSSGWTALVNGKEEKILRANGMFRAIVVPAGESKVVFHYRPAHWMPSILITIAAWLVILILIFRGCRQKAKA